MAEPPPVELDEALERFLIAAAAQLGTPCYVYRLAGVAGRIDRLRHAFGGRVSISFAVKANPNRELLRRLGPQLDRLDVSSAGELRRALDAGYPAPSVTFTGPAKRDAEITEAVAAGVTVVCESRLDLDRVDAAAASADRVVPAIIRVNPRRMPDGYGIPMAGTPSQFGIDEEELDDVLATFDRWRQLRFEGFHVYAGSNALNAKVVASALTACLDLFVAAAQRHGLNPRLAVIGPGLGVAYHHGQSDLDIDEVGRRTRSAIARALRPGAPLAAAEIVLEVGRWLVAPEGWLVARVLGRKRSRGIELRMLDAGFHVHLAASGMLGSVIRRAWPMHALGTGSRATERVRVTGPLCTSLDMLAPEIELPRLEVGDLVAVAQSGAYGLTASPLRFIDHPIPREGLVIDGELVDVTEADATGRRP